jgi:thiamine pyrophosphate-dependent acetolactate synthase large subunit-like protein
MGELTTLVKYGMDVTHVLLNDDELGKISKEQRDGGWDVWETDLVNPGFAAFAENCGAMGCRVDDEDSLGTALSTGRRSSRSRPTPTRCDDGYKRPWDLDRPPPQRLYASGPNTCP